VPIIVYQCPECWKEVERLQRNSDNKVIYCDICKVQLNKKFSVPNIRFKGEGWTPKFHG